MACDIKHRLAALSDKLDDAAHALTISDLSQPAHPLVFVNKTFTDITGFGEEVLGRNCRFLQAGLENDQPRKTVRDALEARKPCHVILHNRRSTGARFFNLLLLDFLPGNRTVPPLCIGSQFDLGSRDPAHRQEGAIYAPFDGSEVLVRLPTKMQLEHRRLFVQSARKVIESWSLLQDLSP